MYLRKNILTSFALTIILLMPLADAFAFIDGQAATTVLGQPDFTTITGGSGTSKIAAPFGVAFDSAGNLWVADRINHRVLKFTAPFSNGQAASVVIGQPDFTTITGGSGNTKLSVPTSVAFDSAGNLFVVETGNHRVTKFTAPLTTGMAASVVIGQPDFTTVTSGSGNTKLNFPIGLALDSAGNLWVADTDNNRVLKFTAPLTSGKTASVVLGQPDFTTVTIGSGTSQFFKPTGDLAFDFAGNLLVPDRGNNRVMKFTAPLTTGMAASTVIGQPDFATVTTGSGTSKMAAPSGVALDSAGNLLVADTFNNRVLKFTAPLTTGMAATNVIGQPDFTTVTIGSGTSKLNQPFDVTLDGVGNLGVADLVNNRVMIFLASISGSQVTGNVNVLTQTCGLSVISGSPISYGSLFTGDTSTEQTLVLDNTGSATATLQVKGSNWLDGSLINRMNVDNTKYSITTGTYASKTSLLTTDQTITGSMSPTVNLDTFWQLQVNLVGPFSGALTQTMDFTTTC